MLTTKETAIQTALQATRNHDEQLDTKDSQEQAWAVPVGILGITIASIASDLFPTY